MFDTFEPTEEATERAGRRAVVLAELVEIGMTLARGLRDEVVAGAAPGPVDPALAFSRLSRAIRLTVLLEARFDEDHRTAQAAWSRKLELNRSLGVAPARRGSTRKARPDVEVEAREREADVEIECLREALEDELDMDEPFDLDTRPMSERMALICKTLGVPFNPEPWADWTPDAANGRPGRGRRSDDPPS